MTSNFIDTGVRYRNVNGAEVHVTEHATSSSRSGWRCEGCQKNEEMSVWSTTSAHTAAEDHSKKCTALPPKPSTT